MLGQGLYPLTDLDNRRRLLDDAQGLAELRVAVDDPLPRPTALGNLRSSLWLADAPLPGAAHPAHVLTDPKPQNPKTPR